MAQEIFELIRADNTIYANRTLAAAIGLNEAVIFSALLSKEHYYRSSGQLDSEDMFYSTASDLEESTTLTQRQQDRAVTRLEEFGLIHTKVKGLPARKYFRINSDTETILTLLREKPNRKTAKETIIKKQDDTDDNSNSGSDTDDSGGETSQNSDEDDSETSFDKMSKLGSDDRQNKFQQNVETGIDEMLKQGSTKSENKNQQKSEPIINKNNNKNIYNKNNARARDETGNSDTLDYNFIELINNFTGNEDLRTAISEYIKMRLKRTKTVTSVYAVTLALKRLTELSTEPEMQVKILNQSILNSYPDLYELKKGGEYNDYHSKSANNRGLDKACFTELAGGKTNGKDNRIPDFSGVIRLGAPN